MNNSKNSTEYVTANIGSMILKDIVFNQSQITTIFAERKSISSTWLQATDKTKSVQIGDII